MAQKKKNISEYNRIVLSWVQNAFIIFMFSFYPLYLHNKYFDVTITKYNVLKTGVVVFGILFVLAALFNYLGSLSYKNKTSDEMAGASNTRCKLDYVSIIFMVLFLISAIIAFVIAEDKAAAFTGSEGRRCGLQFVILVTFMFFCFAYGVEISKWVFVVFAGMASFSGIVGILQHLDINAFGLLTGVNSSQLTKFMSTFGNINIFSSFISVAVGLLLGLSIFEKNKVVYIIYMIALSVMGGSVIAANSDSVYIGVFFATVLMLFISVIKRRELRYLASLLAMCFGYVVVTVISEMSGKGIDKLEGISGVLCKQKPAMFIFAILLISFLCKLVIQCRQSKLNMNKDDHCNNKLYKYMSEDKILKVKLFTLFIGIVILVISVCAYGISHKWSIFVFDKNWGSYRGYVWPRIIKIYNDFPLVKKIFGNGNESVLALMNELYHDEMLDVTGTVYDNAHNEYLQYMVTQGLFGAVSYIGLIVSAIVNGVKKGKDDFVAYAFAACVLAYASQGFINLNQSITTPYVFLMVALITGMGRYKKVAVSRG